MEQSSTVFISADHGLALIYFLQSDVLSTLLESGCRVVALVEDGLQDTLAGKFGHDGLIFEGLRLELAAAYAAEKSPEVQWWLQFLRRVGGSQRINTAAMDSYVRQVAVEEPTRRRILMPLAWLVIAILRRSRQVRRMLLDLQHRYTPQLYSDLFDRYQPGLVVASTEGWRLDRYLLREARRRGASTAAAIVGWDNPSSYSLPGAAVDWVNCWSPIQKEELVLGADWNPAKVNIGGIPSYDGYFRQEWLIAKESYFHAHGLDPTRRLLSYACSFVTFAPNLRNVESLANLVAANRLSQPCQLLIRLHPNHFLNSAIYARERAQIQLIADKLPHVHVVEPVPLGGRLAHYSGEDMPEKSSMMAHSDVFLTVYSTMVVETAIHDTPMVSLCLDTRGGWNTARKYSLPLSQIGNWPTHHRFRQSGAGRIVEDEAELPSVINRYLQQPDADHLERRTFVEREVFYTDGGAGRRTGEFLRGLLLR